MTKHKHLTLDNRSTIEVYLKRNASFREIATVLKKDPSTISKEVRSHLLFTRTGGGYRSYNACSHRFSCEKHLICSICHSNRKFKHCKNCSMCNSFCSDFDQVICPRLAKPPYCCNGCKMRYSCTLEKRTYQADVAHSQYRTTLSETRSGISFSEEEIHHLDEIISPLIRQSQSPHHICATNPDTIMVSERTIYRLIDSRILSAMNLDLPRKVRFSARKQKVHVKVDKSCRINRDYGCYCSYIEKYPDTPIVQLDSVEGKKGGKVLLTIHFVKSEMMLAFLRDHNDSLSVIRIFNFLYDLLGIDDFKSIFRLCLADNGSEFSNPKAIEFDEQGIQRTQLFYCDPGAPYQKGSAERNHEFIRYFIPKGSDFSKYTQADITQMMNHINSYARKSLGNKCPYEVFEFLYGKKILDLLECHQIPPQDVTLNRSIFSKEVSHDD